ncbi:hypothetical protein Pla108_20160 [Botrimarina colliarenosi]|uniref:DUF4159 domain-containing protein n=1 Tax=Botrimarina colliarenosi TaxID=2528001 RepID=A0A5C6ACU0_9BACT|nr:hypothetical protein [Botrimarina colliarenosi]TWT97862.1 hypothetical protein Pla108_20160 [Botrimarina colliarenosi]
MTGLGRVGLLFAFTQLIITAPAAATSGGVVELPPARNGSPAFSPRHGLNIELDSRWLDAGGYRPVRVRFDTATPAAVDRLLAVELKFSDSGRPGDTDLTVQDEVLLPGGADSVEMVVRCPSISDWALHWWTVRVDGEVDPALSTDMKTAMPLPTTARESMFRLLRPTRSAGKSTTGLASERSTEQITVGQRGRFLMERLTSESLDSWIDYASAEVITVDLPTLRRFAERPESQVTALRRWLLAGGMVWVENTGGTAQNYREINELLRLERWRFTTTDEAPSEKETPPPTTQAEETAEVASQGETQTPNVRERRGGTTPIEEAPGWGYSQVTFDDQIEGFGPPIDRIRSLINQQRPTDTRGWCAQREAGFGRIVAFDQLPFDVPDALRRGPSRQVMASWESYRWSARHGVEPDGASADFGNLLIPGVGVAPVNEFQILITLFVLAIGPLNYWLLWRRQQLHLLVLTTPLYACVATLGLVAYAAVADGFGVKARVRSITLLDQTTGEAASWSRVSHYAATLPDEPMTLPADTAIYPLEPIWESAFAEREAARTLRWVGDQQVLGSGWAPPRTTVQHLLVRCRTSPARVELTGQGSNVRIANRLGAPIDLIVVRDSEGGWLRAVAVTEGATANLEPVERLDAMQSFRTLAISNIPTSPAGAGKAVEDTLERLGASRDIRRMQRTLPASAVGDNLANRVIDALTGIDGGRSLDVPPQSYVAVTTRAVETPLGWDSVDELGSFHIVVGRW